MPRLFIISGCNGAGKTTASYTFLPKQLDCAEFINSDEFAKSLSPFDPDAASIMAGKYMLMKMEYLSKKRKDFGIESTLATRSLKATIRHAQENGYTVTIMYLWLRSPELAIQRVNARINLGGHKVQEETVIRRYRSGLINFFTEYRDLCDNWIFADNSDMKMQIVAEGSQRGITIYNIPKWLEIRRSLLKETESDKK